MSGEYPIKVLCATLTVSRSGYYAWGSATDSTHARRDRELRAKIAVVHQQSRETYGSPRITVELRALADHGLVASMSRRGNCYDNAAMEAFWSSLKNELVQRRHFTTRGEARTAIFDYFEAFYNRTRRHSSLGYQSPLDYESTLN